MSDRLWRRIAAFAGARAAIPTLIVAAIALGWALIMYPKLTIGDQQVGVPELRPDSRYNVASRVIGQNRSEEHTSELKSLIRISYAVFCLKKKKYNSTITQRIHQ